MLPEASYLSRFFTKFVEIVAGGLATAMCAYLIGHLGGPLPSAVPAPAAVSAASTTGGIAAGPPAQPAPPVAAAAVGEQRRATQPVTDAPPAQPARKAEKAEKAAVAAPAPKDNKASASAARGEKSAEALARAALANLDADRPAPADAPVRRNLTGADAAAIELQARPADVLPRPADIQPPPAAVNAQPPHVATLDPPPPNPASPSELAPPQPESQLRQDKSLFSFLKRMPDLLHPGSPSFAEAPRPPLPVGTPRTE